jgi:RNA polymerase sigma-70 factor (ECF subfamily)
LSWVQGAHAAPGRVSFIQTALSAGLFPGLGRFLIHFRNRLIGNKISLQAVSSMSLGVQGKGLDVLDSQSRVRFEQLVLPHLDAAYNLSRWLLHGRADAEDVAQEAMLRAVRFFRGFHGGDARSWLLQIVRNTCYTWLEKNRRVDLNTEFDEELHTKPSVTPETLAIAGDNRERLTRALEDLPLHFREVLVLRELEGCSYKEIATITSVPIGTVMSALARARQRLQRALTQPESIKKQEASYEL